MNALRFIWRLLISLKFAVLIMSGLTLSLIIATVLESVYDTPTAQYWVYRTIWFYGLLFLLGLLILCVALSRLPWKPRHTPFLTAHLGILILLYGSWLTFQFGLDGNLIIDEGRTESGVELQDTVLVLAEENAVQTITVPWTPPNATFKPIEISQYELKVSEWIAHAESQVGFVAQDPMLSVDSPAALKLKIAGGPTAPPFMRQGQEFWLWLGDPQWSDTKVGAARALFVTGIDPLSKLQMGGTSPMIAFRYDSVTPSKLKYWVKTSDGKQSQSEFKLNIDQPEKLKGQIIKTGWKFDAQVTILDWIPRAVSDVKYVPARIQYGQQAPTGAIKVEAKTGAHIWLGLGERASFESQGKKMNLGFFPRRVSLPFGVQLHEFKVDRYPGSMNPMEFKSLISVKDGPQKFWIQMNEPFKHGGYTFYQASYIDAQPRPVTTILSVNQDPGRWLKYLGSLLIVLGTISLFAVKYVKKGKTT